MNDIAQTAVEVTLAYYRGEDDPEEGIFATRPVDPEFTNELKIAVYIEDDSVGPPPEVLRKGPLQVQLSGTSRALEAFGTYLVALARLDTADPDPHEHFEDVGNEHGGTLHLIVRRNE